MIYLAGKISDNNKAQEEANKLKFYAKTQELRELGLEVYNPAEDEDGGETWEKYLAKDLHTIFSGKIDKGFMMKGWEDSLGARLEHEAFLRLQKTNTQFKIIYEQ